MNPQINLLCDAAWAAFPVFQAKTNAERAAFLDEIASQIEKLGDELLATASAETNLPLPRLTGERARTCGQFRMFANLIRSEGWNAETIDPADPTRTPPKPHLRRYLVPVGPVAVFGASNFPLAYSVPGGDTASAIAAGCPVVVKAHPAHPKTSELCAAAITRAVEACEMPSGTFALVHGGFEEGQDLVQHPHIRAVGFTGSHSGGRALFDLASRRERPIPVYAEMGSVNPVFLFPDALTSRTAELAKGYAGSLTLGVGQFCTNPGIVVALDSTDLDQFLLSLVAELDTVPAGNMLHKGIADRYVQDTAEFAAHAHLETLLAPNAAGSPALFGTTAANFLSNPEIRQEVFGPAAVIVKCELIEDFEAVADVLEGQLTASIHFDKNEEAKALSLLPTLTRIAGRIVANGWPTGVEVSPAMTHGGPYPASTDTRTTSVGTHAIDRFLRPVTLQGMPVSSV
jgi:NADP-dependent aldehyde dehydrogenase